MMHYGPTWRQERKAFHQHFNATSSQTYVKAQTLDTRRMLLHMFQSPEDFREHINLYAVCAL